MQWDAKFTVLKQQLPKRKTEVVHDASKTVFYMILHNDIMANGPNPNSSYIQVNSLVNRRLKLPPIATSCKGEGNSNRYSNGISDLQSSQDYNIPHIGLENSGTLTDTHSKDVMDSTFSFPRVYTVLPPIGKTFAPATSATAILPSAPSSIRKHKGSTRRPRVKKPLPNGQLDDVSKDVNVSNPELLVDNESVIKTSVDDSEKINSESISVDIPDCVESTGVESCLETKNVLETSNSDNSKSNNRKKSSEKAANLGPDTIYATISEPVTNDNVYTDNEFSSEIPFPQFSTIPEELRLYADVYPPSPPPNERKAKIMVEKTRQLIAEENNYRISFFEDDGYRRRNATCAELDDTLKNAVQLLRELFLRKTMEELCMLW